MRLQINGKEYEVRGAGMLLPALRDELGMSGTRFGCGAGICGACTVHVDGKATRSCITPVESVKDASIRTIEGLAESTGSADLHPLQAAFIKHQVPQCGWCMSGQIMTAAALLEDPEIRSESELLDGMSWNYCRCGTYVRIRAAVLEALQEARAAKLGSSEPGEGKS